MSIYICVLVYVSGIKSEYQQPLDKTHTVALRGLTHQEILTKVRQQGELVGATLLRPTRTIRSSLCQGQGLDSPCKGHPLCRSSLNQEQFEFTSRVSSINILCIKDFFYRGTLLLVLVIA